MLAPLAKNWPEARRSIRKLRVFFFVFQLLRFTVSLVFALHILGLEDANTPGIS